MSENSTGENSSDPSSEEEDDVNSNIEEAIDILLAEPHVIPVDKAAKRSIAQWAVSNRISASALSDLLTRLLNDLKLEYFRGSTDSRTLLKSLREKLVFRDVPPGKYYHFGFVSGLLESLADMKSRHIHFDEGVLIETLLNIDGVPLSKSSTSQFWPILAMVYGTNGAGVFIIGLYHGYSKPDDINVFLAEFADEFLQVKADGVLFDGKTFPVTICGLLCDAPALELALNCVSHNAYFACPKCTTEGEWIWNAKGTGGCVTFPEVNAPLRTDSSFRRRDQRKHHKHRKGRSIIEQLIDDLIGDGPIDYMHAACIGVMKKLLIAWTTTKHSPFKLSKEAQERVSRFLKYCEQFISSEFARKTRPLRDLPHFKATEHRLHLLYVTAVAFKQVLPPKYYNHFLLFHVALKILMDENLCSRYYRYAETLLKQFVTDCKILYGPAFISYNVHVLIHLARDAFKYGSLCRVSCFPFENKNQLIINLVRTGARPLEQAVRRIHELKNLSAVQEITSRQTTFSYSRPHYSGPLPDGCCPDLQCSNVQYYAWKLSAKSPNNCVLLKDRKVLLLDNFIRLNGKWFLVGTEFQTRKPLYKYPLSSFSLNELVVSNLSTTHQMWPIENLFCKLLCIPMFEARDGSNFLSPLMMYGAAEPLAADH